MKLRCFASCLFLFFGSGFIAAIANVHNQSDPAPRVGTAISGSRIEAMAEGSHVRTHCAVIRSNTVYREKTDFVPSLQALSSETHLDVREPDIGASTSAAFEAVISADVVTMRTSTLSREVYGEQTRTYESADGKIRFRIAPTDTVPDGAGVEVKLDMKVGGSAGAQGSVTAVGQPFPLVRLTSEGTATVSLQVGTEYFLEHYSVQQGNDLGETGSTEFSIALDGCVTSLSVTRLSQGDPRWGGDPYDHLAPATMSDKGCALTSLLMAMNYAGLTGVTPGTLNSAATALPGGFVGGGVNWVPVAGIENFGFAQTIPGIRSMTSLQAAKDYLDHVLCGLERPVVVGVFNHPGLGTDTGPACRPNRYGQLDPCHFVLVTGKQTDGKYTIADPGNASHTTLDAYGNRFETRGYVKPRGPRILRTSPGISASRAIEQLFVASSGRVSMLMLDPAGHRTGIDSVSGERPEEIPNSAYFVDSLSNDVTDEEGEASQSVYVEPPSIGRYEIRVTPFEDGPFSLLATARSADGSGTTLLSIDGIGVTGQTQSFLVSVESTNLANISTRLRVETGDNALIAGFIIAGTQPKKVMVRAIGPSLPLADNLADPTLELRNSSGTLLDSNDDWQQSPNKQAIIDSTIPPSNDLESAIVAMLPANNAGYTAIVRGKDGRTGIGVVEAYDLDTSVASKLANIATRGFVQTGDNVLIAGTIVVGQLPQKVIVRAIGPSLTGFGVSGALQDPNLELRDGNGALVAANDNWRGAQEAEIIATTIPPSNDFESAIVATLPSNGASYTAIVRGVNNTTGIAVVEVYGLD